MKKSFFIIGLVTVSMLARAHPGIGIVMDSKGNVYYTDLTHVWKIDPQGRSSIAVHHVHTHELYLDTQDNLFGSDVTYSGEATDKWYYRVWKLGTDGHLEDVIPKTEGFLSGYSFVRDSAGNMYFQSGDPANMLKKRKANGEIIDFVKRPFEDIRWITCTGEGTVYLIDGPRIVKVDKSGRPVVLSENFREHKASHSFLNDRHNLMGLWTDTQDNLYVAVYGGRMIKKITPENEISIVLETEFDWAPSGGMISPEGELWVLECSIMNKVRVRRISGDGTITTFQN